MAKKRVFRSSDGSTWVIPEDVVSRLENWKFAQALNKLTDPVDGAVPDSVPDDFRDGVRALATVFENCGWFGGELSTIVGMAITHLVGEEEEA